VQDQNQNDLYLLLNELINHNLHNIEIYDLIDSKGKFSNSNHSLVSIGPNLNHLVIEQFSDSWNVLICNQNISSFLRTGYLDYSP